MPNKPLPTASEARVTAQEMAQSRANSNALVVQEKFESIAEDFEEAINDLFQSIVERNEVFGIPDSEAKRWTSIGKTNIQQGLLAIQKAMFNPTEFV